MASAVTQSSALRDAYADASGAFTVRTGGRAIQSMNAYSAALAFINGELDVTGDIFAAIRFVLDQPKSKVLDFCYGSLARLSSLMPKRWSAERNIQFHYDRSNEFYALFLDSRMQYSEAHFRTPEMSLDDAQAEKLNRICRALELKSGERFLDIGCGWGGLILWAAEHYGVIAHGCTLSREQLTFTQELISTRGLQERLSVELRHYKDLPGTYDTIASVGMFEHVGKELPAYFRKVHSILGEGGLFLNRGIVRPEGVRDDPESLFLQRNVFPGGRLVHLSDVMREGENAGFRVVSMEDCTLHYALTCRAWVNRLRANQQACEGLVGPATYRTWLLYLAASAVNFESGTTRASQVVFRKP